MAKENDTYASREKMEKIVETNWLKKRIAEYKELIKSGTISEEEAKKRINLLEMRLVELVKERFSS